MQKKIKKFVFSTLACVLLLMFLSCLSLAIDVSSGEVTLLTAEQAELSGEDIKLENIKSDSPNICYWAPGCSVSWNIQVETAGTYKVVLNYARASTQSDLPVVVKAGDRSISYELAPTGNWENYLDLEIGEIMLSTEDTVILVSHGDNLKADLMNLRYVTLERVENVSEKEGFKAGTEIFILTFTGASLAYAGFGAVKKKNKKKNNARR